MRFSMWSRHGCPACKADLKRNPPKPPEYPWYKLVSRYTLKCPACGVSIERRFADFDMALAYGMMSGGAVSIWGAGKIVLPMIAVLIAARIVAGRILPVYVPSKF